jgi:hypothetical protein
MEAVTELVVNIKGIAQAEIANEVNEFVVAYTGVLSSIAGRFGAATVFVCRLACAAAWFLSLLTDGRHQSDASVLFDSPSLGCRFPVPDKNLVTRSCQIHTAPCLCQ